MKLSGNRLRLICHLLFLLAGHELFSQSVIKGRVVDAVTNQPVVLADIYLISTTFGTTSDVSGDFSFKVSSKGKYEMVVSYVGYDKFQSPVLIDDDSTFTFDIRLFSGSSKLQDVIVQADTSHRKRDFREFQRIFLGQTINSSSCSILNPKDIYVYQDETLNELIAISKKSIIVQNLSLGYLVYYDLEHFQSTPPNSSIVGTPRFKEFVAKDQKQQARWQKARRVSYEGSLTHFMRSVYSDRLEEEGWEVLIEYPELRPPDSYIVKKINQQRDIKNWDSLEYYRYIRLIPPGKHILSKPIKGKMLIDKQHPNQLNFKGKLLVTYKNERDERVAAIKNKALPLQLSIVVFSGSRVTIYENGYFEPQESVRIEGYLGFAERISEFLPYNYQYQSK